ncbi:MAG: S8 family serine peptidase [Nitrospinae bacterium]|nr:S8 family serine peptidase [Nitrospinota bacterium]MBF0633672.1 S8 family serine peptidase [Nitrospinota bacterium]
MLNLDRTAYFQRPASFALLLSFIASIFLGGVAHSQNLTNPRLKSSAQSWAGPLVDEALNKKIQPAPKGAQLPALQATLAANGSVRVIVGLNLPFQPMGNIPPNAQTAQAVALANAQKDLLNTLAGHNIQSVKTFRHIPYMAMSVDLSALNALAANPMVSVIEEDRIVRPTLLESVPLIKADTAWGMGYTGTGWTVAVLDTGVDKTHYMLDAGKVVAEACYSTTDAANGSTSVCPNGANSQMGSGAGIDCNAKFSEAPGACDHGTHVAGIAAASGLGLTPSINGIAKNASVIAVQVFSRFEAADCGGISPCAMGFTSDLISGLDHVFSLRNTHQIASVNMSLGGGRFFSACDSTETATKAAIDNLRSVGIATVIASGNSGYKDSMGAPGCISTAVSVGATCDSAGGSCAGADSVATYSNSASFLSILAPGSYITSSIPGNMIAIKSGTSMATPHVAGAWALMKQKDPAGSVATILSTLQSTGVPITDTNAIAKPRIALDLALGGNTTTLGDAVDNPSLTWSSSGNAHWLPDSMIFNTGGSAARSGSITHSQNSIIQTTVTGPGSLSFFWKVSSESGYDFLRFSIDGVVQGTGISGEQAWAQQTANIPAGSHTISWTYSKDSSVSSGRDAGWLDTVVFTPQNGIAVTATAGTCGTVIPSSQSVVSGSTATFTVTPDTGCTTSAAVGGTCAVGSWNSTHYTTGAVTSACSVSFTFTGTQVSTGSLTVTLSPSTAVTFGARWNVDGGAWQASGAMVTGLSAGAHTVSFGDVIGYATPSSRSVTITAGMNTTLTEYYDEVFGSTGSLTVFISPPEAVTAGAEWSIDGGYTWNASGATISFLTAKRVTVSYYTAPGFVSPVDQAVTLTLGATTTATGTYTAMTGLGSLKVNTSPAWAGGEWSVDYGAWQASGTTVTGLSAGSHTVMFNTVVDYTVPRDQIVTIRNGQITTITGTYKQHGSLLVNISPTWAVTSGARWSIDDGITWNDSGFELMNLDAGNYTVTFDTAVFGCSPPPNKVVRVTSGPAITRATGTYTVGYTVSATRTTGGTVTPARKAVFGFPVTFTVKANPGYTRSDIVGGTCDIGEWDTPTGTPTKYTIGSVIPVTEACTVSFTFTKAPTATTGSATNIKQAEATLNGKVNPENQEWTMLSFEYVDDTSYMANSNAYPLTSSYVSAGVFIGGASQAVAAPLTGLTCGTKYHFRVVADYLSDPFTTIGADRTFTTSACLPPTAATVGASNVTATGATLKGVVNPNKAATTVTFEYVPDASYAVNTYGTTVSVGTVNGIQRPVSASVTGLTCGTKYHFRVKAVNAVGTGHGLDKTFTTSACADRAADSNMVKALVSDFDGDGKSDIVFRDAVSGQTAVWMMNGAKVISNALTSMSAGAYTSTTGWQAQGIGDFDGDGKSDLLWRDAESGQLAIWTMNGASVVTSATTNVNPSSGWQVHGIGDFNGDGKSDILFRHAVSGETSIWFMNGEVKKGGGRTSSTAGAYTSTTGWQVQGVGDFNGDGKSDILWRHAGTGKTIVWFMNGASVTNRAVTTVQAGAYTSTVGWQVQGAGDFNADGKSDILWRDAQTGRMAIWMMDGAKVSSGSYTSVDAGVYTSTTGLHVSAIADYNGDGKSDILLRDAETGQTRVWTMNGSQVTSDTATDVNPGAYTSATGWSVVSEESVR